MIASNRRVLYKKYRLQGYSGIAAAVKAGYALSTAQCGRLHKAVGDDLQTALERHGFDNSFIAKRVIEKMAIKDESIGHKYFETGLKLAKKLGNDSSVQNLVDKQQINIFLPAPAQEIPPRLT